MQKKDLHDVGLRAVINRGVEISDASALAHQQFLGETRDRDPGTERCVLSDYLGRAIAKHVSGFSLVSTHSGKHLVLLKDCAILRVKAVNERVECRNAQTRGLEMWLKNLQLPGIPARLPRFDLSYELDPRSADIRRLMLIDRGWRILRGQYPLPWRGVIEAPDVALELDLGELDVRPRDIARKRGRRAEGK